MANESRLRFGLIAAVAAAAAAATSTGPEAARCEQIMAGTLVQYTPWIKKPLLPLVKQKQKQTG
jgi:hypothetical protein